MENKTTMTITSGGVTAEMTTDEFKAAVDRAVTEEALMDKSDMEIEPKFVPAPEVQRVAARLISDVPRFHHLADARIAYLFRTDTWESKGRTVMGRVYVNDERKMIQTNKDLEIVVNRRVWNEADEQQREALVAHELCHFAAQAPDKHGNPRWSLADHDLEEFAYVVRKYGIWDEALRRFMDAKKQGELERAQVRMFPEDDVS